MSENYFCPGCGSPTPGVHVWAGTGHCPYAVQPKGISDAGHGDEACVIAYCQHAVRAAFERGKAEGARIENEACAQICNRVSDGWEENAMVCRNLILARHQPSGGAK